MYLSADRLEILRERVMLFDDFSNDEILHLLQFAQKKGFSTDDVLVDERDDSGHIHILISGRAGVVRDYPDGPETLAVLEPGATIGEMAMIDGEPRSARVVATSDGVMLNLDSALLEQVGNDILRKLYKNLSTILVRRLRAANQRMEQMAGRGLSESSLDRLSTIDLSGRNLDGVRAKRIGLVGADLRSADLRYADLRGANLTGARLDGAMLTDDHGADQSPSNAVVEQKDTSNTVEESTEHYWERLMKSLAQRARTPEGED